MKKRIYIAGGGGMLGEAFYKRFSCNYELRVTDIDLNTSWLQFLDFRDYDAYREDVLAFQPDYLFHLGAHTNLEYCEEHPEDTYLTNTTSVEHAVRISNELDIPLLFISTAGIFDGSKETYSDWDIPRPAGHYARSKHLAEQFIQRYKDRYLICRAGWMMGGGPGKDKKFVGRILDQLKGGRKKLTIVNDKSGTPTYTHDFAANVQCLLEKEVYGLFNMVCEGQTSRLEVAATILHLLGLGKEISIQEVNSSYFDKIYFAPRPESERLINAKLNQRNLNRMRSWTTCLAEYLQKDYAGYIQSSETELKSAHLNLMLP